MRTPRFWYPQSEDHASALSARALTPLSYLFRAGTWVRKALANPYHARIPVVCIGNVVAGGAGKTPTALALTQLLKEHGEKPIFVTRGYGGKGNLVCVDLAKHQAADVGDEALLLAQEAPTWSGRDRVEGIREAELNGSVIVVDDGFQNPNIMFTSSILVVDGDVGLGNGRIIPAGPLREPFGAALKRATAMIVVGSRDVQGLAAQESVPVFRAHLAPQLPLGFPKFDRFVAFAGLARPEKFFASARNEGMELVATKAFPDHYLYKESDLAALRAEAERLGAHLLTTEKDAVRLPAGFLPEIMVFPVRLIFDSPGAEKALVDLICQETFEP